MKYDVAVVGLGYVGLTLAVALADTGFKVLGVEKRKDVVDLTNEGRPHFSESGLPEMLRHAVQSCALTAAQSFSNDVSADIYVITVGTPLNADGAARRLVQGRGAGAGRGRLAAGGVQRGGGHRRRLRGRIDGPGRRLIAGSRRATAASAVRIGGLAQRSRFGLL